MASEEPEPPVKAGATGPEVSKAEPTSTATEPAPEKAAEPAASEPAQPSKFDPLASARDFTPAARPVGGGSSSSRVPVFRAPAPVPATLGGFRIGNALESSVLGRTFKASNASGAPVHLTLIERDDPALRARVATALDVLAKIDHPHLAKVAGHGQEGELHYYALSVPDCVTLLDFVRRGRPLDGAEIAWVGTQLASALAALHEKGIAHGDVTPVNVGITIDGNATLADLGWSPRVRDAAFDSKIAEASANDLGQLGATLVFATTGQAVRPKTSGRQTRPSSASASAVARPAARLIERASWLTPTVADFLNVLTDDPVLRPKAIEAESKLRGALAEFKLPHDGPPTDLVDTARSLLTDQSTLAGKTTAGSGSRGGVPAPALGGFGRYVLVEEIARGGMGVVYRARHAELNRLFALKVLLSGETAGDVTRKRFLREAEAAAQLDHPSIVRVHDFGEHEGRAYLAMDFAEGRSLASMIPEDVPRERLYALVAKVCDAVHYAHSRGIIHRDLKPQNVVVDSKDVPHILDFGVAKRLGDPEGRAGAELTTEGELVGTPAYMPPEQAEGRAKDIDTRSDVYALGVMLFEVATRGRLPFEGITVTDVLTKVLLEDPVAPSSISPELPWEVDAIALKAIEKDPKRRYQSAAELAADLRLFLEGRPIVARRATALYRAKKWAIRNRRIMPFVAIAALALAAIPVELARRDREKRRQDEERLAGLVALADSALRTDSDATPSEQKIRDALDDYQKALGLDPASQTAQKGKLKCEVLIEALDRKREADRRAAEFRSNATAFVNQGEESLKAKEADAAQKAFTQALAFDPTNERASQGLAQARLLALTAAAEREAARRKSEIEAQARAKVKEGEAALARGDAEAARGAFFQALAFDASSSEAKEGLRSADRIAYELEAQKQKAKNDDEARKLIASGRAHLEGLDYAAARADFTKALAFDGQNKDALDGLSKVERLERDLAQAAERRKKRDEADKLLAKGDEALARGRALAKDNQDKAQVRDAYFEAMEAFDRASFLADERVYQEKKKSTAAELAALARNQQDWGLAQFLFRIAGTSADAGAEQAPKVEDDDCLVVRESDAILVQRAFREPLSFDEKATKEFLKDVRALVEPKKDHYRLEVTVRTRAVAGPNPVVYLTGLHLRLLDLKQNTTSAPTEINFDGDGYQRIVVAAPAGRMVPSIDKALKNDAPQVLSRVKDAAQAMIEKAEKRP